MANTFDAGLVAATISRETMTVLGNRLAKLALFSTDFSNEVRKPKDTVNVAIASSTNATVVNPTNFTPDSLTVVDKTSVVMNHLAQFFGVSESDLASGHRLEQLVKVNAQAFADKIWATAIAPVTVANFGAAPVTDPTTVTPTGDGLKELWAHVSKADDKGLVLDAATYSQLIPTSTESLTLSDGAYGFENGVHYATTFTGAEAGVQGFSCSKDAIAIACAAPAIDASVSQNFYSSEVVLLEDLGLSVYTNVYGDISTRQVTASMEIMMGASAAVTANTLGIIKP